MQKIQYRVEERFCSQDQKQRRQRVQALMESCLCGQPAAGQDGTPGEDAPAAEREPR